jgi:hypothetical protein
MFDFSYFLPLANFSCSSCEELQWFRNDLENRTRRLLFDGNYSEEQLIELGVPQGSAIGLLLFLLYVDDLAIVTQNYCVNLFADNTDNTLIFICELRSLHCFELASS